MTDAEKEMREACEGVLQWSHRGVGEFLKRHAKYFNGGELPDGMERGERKRCFETATDWVLNHYRLAPVGLSECFSMY